MSEVTKPIALDESLNTTESTPRNIADVLADELVISDLVTQAQAIVTKLQGIISAVKPDASDIPLDPITGMTANNVQLGISELKGTLVNLADTFILYNVVKVGYQVLSDSNRVIIWLYTSYTDSSHYEAFRIDFNGSNHRIFFQKLVNGAETTIGYVTLS